MTGVAAGLLVAATMTTLDWRLNPGGIFYNAQGTNWPVATETAMSWFVPVSVIVGALVTPLLD